MALETPSRLPRARDDEPVVTRRVLAIVKRAAHSVLRTPRDQRRLVLIFGCQRSGTTMLQQTILDRSWQILIIEEHDRRLVGSAQVALETAWEDYPTVVRRLRQFPFDVVAAKPLVESSRAGQLMTVADPVKAIWMLRHYDAVAASNVRRFGRDNPYRDLQPFCDNDPVNWRSRDATRETRDTVSALMREGLSPHDAAALFWWARNQLYFDQGLWRDERIRILRYERACNQAEDAVEALSGYLGLALPTTTIVSKMRPEPVGRRYEDLHPDVDRLCREMWESFTGLPEL